METPKITVILEISLNPFSENISSEKLRQEARHAATRLIEEIKHDYEGEDHMGFLIEELKEVEVENTYIPKGHPCFENGHNFFITNTHDNGRSKFSYCKCTRCGEEEEFQFDYG